VILKATPTLVSPVPPVFAASAVLPKVSCVDTDTFLTKSVPSSKSRTPDLALPTVVTAISDPPVEFLPVPKTCTAIAVDARSPAGAEIS